jgi:hypothetical protein
MNKAGHVVYMEDMRNIHKVLTGEPQIMKIFACFLYSSFLKTEAVCSSAMLVILCHTARCHIASQKILILS